MRTDLIASLMMYQRPELAGAHDRFWELIRDELVARGMDAPHSLAQEADEFFVWKHPNLVLSQTCGMPYRLWLHDQVNLVGTPDYGLDGCSPGYYRSAIIVRKDDPRQTIDEFKEGIFAYNQTFSQSGFAAPYGYMQNHGFWFEKQIQSHAHLASAKAVAGGQADIAALDAVSWRLIQRFEQIANDLRVLDWTEPTPGLPLITAKRNPTDLVFDVVKQSLTKLSPKDSGLIGIKDIVFIPKDAYLAIPNPK